MLDRQVQKPTCLLDRENIDNFLNKVSRIRMTRQLQIVHFDRLTHQTELLIANKQTDEALDRMGPLFGSHKRRDILLDFLHYTDSLVQVAYGKELLDHVVSVLVGHQLRDLFLEVLDDPVDLFGSGLLQEILEKPGSDVIANVSFKLVVLDQAIQVDCLV